VYAHELWRMACKLQKPPEFVEESKGVLHETEPPRACDRLAVERYCGALRAVDAWMAAIVGVQLATLLLPRSSLLKWLPPSRGDIRAFLHERHARELRPAACHDRDGLTWWCVPSPHPLPTASCCACLPVAVSRAAACGCMHACCSWGRCKRPRLLCREEHGWPALKDILCCMLDAAPQRLSCSQAYAKLLTLLENMQTKGVH
jgi:hypothetical protein